MNIGYKEVGNGWPVFVIAEIGINHNGSLEMARRLMEAAKKAGADAVKFQKRTVEVVYSQEELARVRQSPFGTTNGDLKRALEFGTSEYFAINAYADVLKIDWFASSWDEGALDFFDDFNPPCYKIASASITDMHLLARTRSKGKPIILSTGGCCWDQVDHAVDVLGKEDLVLMHICSAYPSYDDELNLRVIPAMIKRYGLPVGYSGHETGLATTIAAVALGACVVERHITLDRALWGSDQAASLEPAEFTQLVTDIRRVEAALGDGQKRMMEREVPVMEKLRRVK